MSRRYSGLLVRDGQLLIRFLLFGSEIGRGLRIFNRIVDECHILIFCFHMRRSFVIALVRLVFHKLTSFTCLYSPRTSYA
jgi:hypothetical protein